uniref:Heat shock 70 kDa protein 12B n=1 Tax=Magallana gigas TaxID=29159 RepID=K1PYU8_MAGGI
MSPVFNLNLYRHRLSTIGIDTHQSASYVVSISLVTECKMGATCRRILSTDSKKMADKKDKLLTAAIDFGTTYSGYAFSFEYDYKVDPLKISTNPLWVAGSRGLVSLKAPTCVLLSPKQEFITFGYEAEDLYVELALDENHYDHYFFKGFKIFIDEKGQLSKSMLIRDDKGKEAPALDLFAHVIRYLKNHLLSALDAKGATIKNKDIHWVLPVPALWTGSAKQFMREAANKYNDGTSFPCIGNNSKL